MDTRENLDRYFWMQILVLISEIALVVCFIALIYMSRTVGTYLRINSFEDIDFYKLVVYVGIALFGFIFVVTKLGLIIYLTRIITVSRNEDEFIQYTKATLLMQCASLFIWFIFDIWSMVNLNVMRKY
ncbi:hypothetical protein [Mycoplasma seminis]|uniref:Uncharacterized protein n=1 Tax=Mycoplasma seminis TaxID=512749 RepID=A0ABY9HBS0_9MOLU|nr:hypothetical protein [Mycoplasma seminis]WLP85635.1 hypothetical protein Q8852_00525 [Mycoplasma seminis]